MWNWQFFYLLFIQSCLSIQVLSNVWGRSARLNAKEPPSTFTKLHTQVQKVYIYKNFQVGMYLQSRVVQCVSECHSKNYNGVYLLSSWTEICGHPWLPLSIKGCFQISVHSAVSMQMVLWLPKMPLVCCMRWIGSPPARILFSPQTVLFDSTSIHSTEALGGSGQQSRANACCCADMN